MDLRRAEPVISPQYSPLPQQPGESPSYPCSGGRINPGLCDMLQHLPQFIAGQTPLAGCRFKNGAIRVRWAGHVTIWSSSSHT